MAVINTTDIIDSSMFLKSKLPANMVGDNYYIENLQDKRNADWEYRYNRVDIEEELNKQCEYTAQSPSYTPIDAVITNVKSETGVDLGVDWASLSFRDLRHPCNIGYRYRFALDFPDMTQMSEEDKKKNTSIWLAVNRSPIHAGNSCVVRRCNSTLTLVGCENRDITKIREYHIEPVILDNSVMKYTQIYYNEVIPVPQSERYIIAQLNYFTNSIKLNDRFIFGPLDSEVKENNSVFKIKAVSKSNALKTFSDGSVSQELEKIPIVVFGLDRDAIAPKDQLLNGQLLLAENPAKYLVPSTAQPITPDKNGIRCDDFASGVPVGETHSYRFTSVINGQEHSDVPLDFNLVLPGKKEQEWSKYFKFELSEDKTGFDLTVFKPLLGSKLNISVTNDEYILSENYSITLGSTR